MTLTNLSPGLFAVNLSIGFPEHNFLFLVSTTSEFTWVRGVNCTFCSTNENIYDENESISVIYPTQIPFTTMVDIRGSVSGEIAFDDMKIGNLYAAKLEFLIASDDQFIDMADGVLSLGPSTNEGLGNNNNLLSKLYQNGQIRQKVFTINLKDEMTGQLTLGDIPQHIIADKSKYSNCKVHKEFNSNWNCLVSHVLFNDDYNFYNAIPLKNTYVNFETGVSNIYIPTSFIDLFLNNYIKTFPDYSNKKCIINKESKTKHILCLKSFLSIKAPNINFIINGYAYAIPFEDLFEDVISDTYSQYRVFKIDFIETHKNEWYFGTVFLKQHEIVFNDEKGEVGFYSGFKYDFTKLTNENVEEYCLYDTLTIIFLGLVICVPMMYTIWMKKISDDRLNILALKNSRR